MGEPSWRGLFNILGAAAVVLGLVVQAQSFFGIYSEPVKLVTSYLDLVPLYTFILGLATILGANIVRRRRPRVGLLIATVAVLGFFAWETNLAISEPLCGYPATLSIVSSSIACSASTHTCTMSVINSGAGEGRIIGAGPDAGRVTFSAVPTSVPAGSAGTTVTVTMGGSATIGETVMGYLAQDNGLSLPFTAVLQ